MREKRRRLSWLPAIVFFVLVPLRWIFIVGIGDFPSDFVFASRLFLGQIQGVDFAYNHATALPFYPAALLLKIFSGHYIAINFNVWTWWFLNSVSSGWLLRRIGGTISEAVFSSLIVALLLFPPNTNLVTWGFSASFFSTIAVGLFLAPRTRHELRWIFVSGALCGLIATIKSNVGVGTFAAIGIAMAVSIIFKREGVLWKTRNAILLTCGFLAGAGIPLLILGYFGGYAEIFRQGFISAGGAKGSPLFWLLRALPRISLLLDPARKYLIEVAIAIPLFFGLLGGFLVFLKTNRERTNSSRLFSNGTDFFLENWLIVTVALSLSIWSLWPAEFPMVLMNVLYGAGIFSLPEFNNHLLYVVLFAFCCAYLTHHFLILSSTGQKVFQDELFQKWNIFLLGGIVLLVLMANGAGGRYSTVFTAGLFIPFIIRATQGFYYRFCMRVLAGILIFWTISWHVAPSWPSTFGNLTKMPEGSIFSGLYHPSNAPRRGKSYPEFISTKVFFEMQENLPSRISGNSVLWIGTSLEGAFGDIPYRYGLVPMDVGHVEKNEKNIKESLQKKGPKFIIIGDIHLWDKSKLAIPNSFFRSKNFLPWLNLHYKQVWQGSNRPFPVTLWQRKM